MKSGLISPIRRRAHKQAALRHLATVFAHVLNFREIPNS